MSENKTISKVLLLAVLACSMCTAFAVSSDKTAKKTDPSTSSSDASENTSTTHHPISNTDNQDKQ